MLLESIERHLGGRVEVSGSEGGLHILLWLNDTPMRRSADVIARAQQAGVGVYPVAPFYSKLPKRVGLLLGYTSLTESEIAEGIRRLGSVVTSMSASMRS